MYNFSCFYDQKNQKRDLTKIRLSVGKLSISKNEVGQQTFKVAEFIPHSGFRPGSPAFMNDIALVKLSSAVTFTKRIQPIPMAPSNYVPSGKTYGVLINYDLTNSNLHTMYLYCLLKLDFWVHSSYVIQTGL